jgi:hypothetical protein
LSHSQRLEHLQQGLALLSELVQLRLQQLGDNASPVSEAGADPTAMPAIPEAFATRAATLQLIPGQTLDLDQTVLLLSALAPHLQSDLFDRLFTAHLPEAGDFPQLGGARGQQFRGFLPTAETVLFLLAGNQALQRLQLQRLFGADNPLIASHLLSVQTPPAGEPPMCGRLLVAPELLAGLIYGHPVAPSFGADFPATLLSTQREWKELIVGRHTREQLAELRDWLTHRDTLLVDWDMQRVFQRGYRVLFHGPPGTGKTMTASLLGRETGHPVYRIDLSMVVSKYIGETEKNLEKVFQQAGERDWILFFDEADALFGKRTAVKDSHDRYANQEVSYLLQRVEEYDGLCILASNLRANIDDAFLRRFNAIIRFPEPGPEERREIWRRALPDRGDAKVRAGLLDALEAYELTGGGIVNVAQFAAIEAVAAGRNNISLGDVELGIRREVEKEGKVFRSQSGKARQR